MRTEMTIISKASKDRFSGSNLGEVVSLAVRIGRPERSPVLVWMRIYLSIDFAMNYIEWLAAIESPELMRQLYQIVHV